MRGQHFIILVVLAIMAWVVGMYFGPTVTMEVSPYERIGFIFIIMTIGMMYSIQQLIKYTHRFDAPNIKTTLSQPQPFDQVTLPIPSTGPKLNEKTGQPVFDSDGSLIIEDKHTTTFNIYPLGGTHWGPVEGGGKDNGYFVAPDYLCSTWEGEVSSVRVNGLWNVYKEEPDEAKNEHSIDEVPKAIIDKVKRHRKYHPKAPVFVSYVQWQIPDELKVKDLKLVSRYEALEDENTELKKQIENITTSNTKLTEGMRKLSALIGRPDLIQEDKGKLKEFLQGKE